MAKKLITIPHHGPIMVKGGMYGPITTPYMEEISEIFRMVTAGVKISEILEDGSAVELDLSNFDTVKTVEVVEAGPSEAELQKQKDDEEAALLAQLQKEEEDAKAAAAAKQQPQGNKPQQGGKPQQPVANPDKTEVKPDETASK